MTKKDKNTLMINNLEKEVLDRVTAPIFATDKKFNLIFVNAEMCRWYGKDDSDCKELLGKKCFEIFDTSICNTADCPIQKAMATDKISTGKTQARRQDKDLSIEFTANSLKDKQGNIVGGVEIFTDITERLAAEEKARQLQADLMELSTPVLSLWDRILALPLIGTLDSRRMQDAMEKALTRLADEKALVLVVDITGVPLVDTLVANHLIRMALAVRLMGGVCVLTGISPHTAMTIVHLGIDLSGLKTRATLAEGLSIAMELVKKGGETL